ncbi:hypothetical protein A1O1_03932 [Capronia coronata CBS 617.96]|uniref:Major facilitator superfamily (MFS) profile domain-containing protein n=1 Tax=Capronia coronata CBS 617.96 TaxID=1182541 RepID=W9YD96_9EURO|nr:uncharacterized protein A1O1_03932 [Capronia coronata CBS 617.96]EXJ90827.1 hypothetical protein A1O1_03932 [Capronia coronata CBS 617.96]
MVGAATASRSVGATLSSVLPQDARPWYKQRHLVKLNLSIAMIYFCSTTNGYDGSIMNNFLSLPEWNVFMNHPKGAWLGFFNALYWTVVGVWSPFVAHFANKYGRKRVLYYGYIPLVIATALEAAAPNPAVFIVSRGLLGLTTATVGNTAPLLMAETAFPTHRGVATALYNTGFHVGAAVAAWATFGTRSYGSNWSWRVPAILQIICPLIALVGAITIPESPRWLVSVGREEEARRILINTHAGGDENSPLVDYEFREISSTIKLEREANKRGYSEMWRTPGNRHRLFITVTIGLFAEWVGNNVVSYYVSVVLTDVGVTSVTHQIAITGGLQVWNAIIAITAASNVDRLGRRGLFLSSAAVMLVSFIIITACAATFKISGNTTAGLVVVPFLFIFYGGYDLGLNPMLYAYPVEIWPYHLRSRGLSLAWIFLVVSTVFNVFVNPIAMEDIGWKYYIVFDVMILLFGLTAYFFYPETGGRTLEQVAEIFDGVPTQGIEAQEKEGDDFGSDAGASKQPTTEMAAVS